MERIPVEGELSSCPKCGAGGGFHVAFLRVEPKAERKLEVILVCPACRHRFSVGEFLVPDGEPRPFDPSMDL